MAIEMAFLPTVLIHYGHLIPEDMCYLSPYFFQPDFYVEGVLFQNLPNVERISYLRDNIHQYQCNNPIVLKNQGPVVQS